MTLVDNFAPPVRERVDSFCVQARVRAGSAIAKTKAATKNAHAAMHALVPSRFSRMVSKLLRCMDFCLWKIIKGMYSEFRKINLRFVVAFMLYAFFLSIIVSKMRYSVWFTPSVKAVEAIEEQRTQWAEEFIVPYGGELIAADSVAASEDHSLQLCVAIPTAERRNSFLLQTVATVIRSMVRSENINNVLIVNDVNKRRTLRTDPVVAYLEQHGVNVIRSSPCLKKGSSCRSKQKAVLDMAASIEGCLVMTTARYIVYLEDDMVVSAHFMDRVLQAARKISSRPGSWAFLSLFRTGHYDGFSRNFSSLRELVGCGTLSAAGLLALARVISGRSAAAKSETRTQRAQSYALRLTFYSIVITVSIYMLGRQNTLLPLYLNEGLVEDASSPSTAGLVFPRHSAEQFASWLQTPDLDVDKSRAAIVFAERHGLKSYLLRPNPIEHVGRFTSIAAKRTKREIADPLSHFAEFMKVSEWFEEDDFKVSLRSPRDILSFNDANNPKSAEPVAAAMATPEGLRIPLDDVHYVKTTKLARAAGLLFVLSSVFLIMVMGQMDSSRLVGDVLTSALASARGVSPSSAEDKLR